MFDFPDINTDPQKDKRIERISALNYIDGRSRMYHQFLNEKVRKEDWMYVTKELVIEDPVIVANLLKLNYEMTEDGRLDFVIDEVAKDGMFTLVLGAKRHGKTATATWLAEELTERGYTVYWFGYHAELEKHYPKIIQTLDIEKLEKGILIYDETLVTMMGRDAMTKEVKERIKALPTAGHRSLAIVFLTQSLRVDPMIRDLIDWIWFKPIKKSIFETGTEIKKVVQYLIPYHKWENLFYNIQTDIPVFFNNPMPSIWNENMSKPFAIIKERSEAKRVVKKLTEKGFHQRELEIMMRLVGWPLEDLFEDDVTPVTENKTSVYKKKTRKNKARKTAKNKFMITCPKCEGGSYQKYGMDGNRQKLKCLACNHIWRSDKK